MIPFKKSDPEAAYRNLKPGRVQVPLTPATLFEIDTDSGIVWLDLVPFAKLTEVGWGMRVIHTDENG